MDNRASAGDFWAKSKGHPLRRTLVILGVLAALAGLIWFAVHLAQWQQGRRPVLAAHPAQAAVGAASAALAAADAIAGPPPRSGWRQPIRPTFRSPWTVWAL